ncbi:uncharacterized protein BDV17DRAFT_295787 [Aspergillus undulatus]|uniref:uncharacterized protein n=1 Tax=Aspergillus undulatus TaxID=1810928 RepID=UPI003CCDD880
MASLILIGGILLAVKIVDKHDKKKQKELDAQESEKAIPPYSPRAPSISTETEPTSTRNILTRKYWHERKKPRQEAQAQAQAQLAGSLDAPPPYSEQPMYRDLEKTDGPSGLDGRPIEYDRRVGQELPGSPAGAEHPTREEHCMKEQTS